MMKKNNMEKSYLLEKVYDKYQMEIARKDRLESKAIGYYTITGIFFAGFLVVEPILFNSGMLLKFSFKEILGIINYGLIVGYIVSFGISIVLLHNSYKPKLRPEFDPIENWDVLASKDEDEAITIVRDELVGIIKHYEEKNGQIVNKLMHINRLCIVSAGFIVAIFIVLILSYFV